MKKKSKSVERRGEGGGGRGCWGYSRFRLWEGGDGGGEVVEISPVHVYTSIMGKGVYKPSMLYAKAMILI